MSETCHDFQQLMSDALDGRLGPEEQGRFERMLRESDERAREWEAFCEMRERLLGIGTEGAPEELFDRIAGAIRSEAAVAAAAEGSVGRSAQGRSASGSSVSEVAPSQWSHLRVMGWPRAAAVLAVLIGVAVFMTNELGERSTAPDTHDSVVAESDKDLRKLPADRTGDDRLEEETEESDDLEPAGAGKKGAWRADRGFLAAGLDEKRRVFDEVRSEQAVDRLERRSRMERFKNNLDAYEKKIVELGRGPSRESNANVTNDKAERQEVAPAQTMSLRADVMDEAMILIGKNLERFSGAELESRGLGTFAEHADARVHRRLAPKARQRRASPTGAPLTDVDSNEGAPGIRDRQLERSPNEAAKDNPKATPAGQPRPNPAKPLRPENGSVDGNRGRPERESRRRRGSRGGFGGVSRGGRDGRGGVGKSEQPGAGAGTTPSSPGGGGGGRFDQPGEGGKPGAPAIGGLTQAPGGDPTTGEKSLDAATAESGRVFFALLGTDAGRRTRTVLAGIEGVRERDVAPAFRANKGAGSGGGAQPSREAVRRPPARPRTSNTRAYTIFEVTLPADEADALVGRLESTPGLVLRTLGRSLLRGTVSQDPSGAERPRTSNPSRGAAIRGRAAMTADGKRAHGPMRTLVLVVFER